MSLIDDLRQSRSSRVSVLHEFWTQYDPGQKRVHVFFEGHDDLAFYRPFIEQQMAVGGRLVPYRCGGKRGVYEAFDGITQRNPAIRGVLFFVDKDVDDILGKPWPTDPRIFVTDVYSIENYLVSRDSFIRFCQEAVRLGDVGFQLHSPLLDRFDEQLSRFQRLIIPLMAWVVTMRREGQRPILTNINLGEFFEIDVECSVRLRPCKGLNI